eukprot:8336320-Alexandrium_andersonii.AAC.1
MGWANLWLTHVGVSSIHMSEHRGPSTANGQCGPRRSSESANVGGPSPDARGPAQSVPVQAHARAYVPLRARARAHVCV